MKNQNQAAKRGSKSAAVSQVKIQPNGAGELFDPPSEKLRRAPGPRSSAVAILLLNKQGEVIERVEMYQELYDLANRAAKDRGWTFKQFFFAAIRSHIRSAALGQSQKGVAR